MSRLDRYKPQGEPLLARAMLWCCDRLRWLYVAAGIDFAEFRLLLRSKLEVDNRRRGTDNWSMVAQLGFAMLLALDWLVGMMIAIVLLVVDAPMWGISIAMAVTMSLIALHMVIDFSHLLVDTTDLDVIEPLPIDPRSLLAVRISHVALYVAAMVAAISLSPLMLAPFAHGLWPFVPVYLFSAAASGLLVLLGITLTYLVVLRFAPARRVRDAMLTLQLLLVTGLFGGLHLAPQLFEQLELGALLEANRELLLAVPPCWYGGLHDVLAGARDPLSLAMATAALLGPLLLILLVRMVTGGQSVMAQLIALDRGEAQSAPPRPSHGLTGRVAGWLRCTPIERAGYEFALANASRDRGFRMRTWPNLAMAVMPMAGLLFLDARIDWRMFLPYMTYLGVFVAMAVPPQASCTDQPEATWLLAGLDPGERSEFARGGLIGLLVRYAGIPLLAYAPVALLLGGDPAGLHFAVCASVVLGVWLSIEIIDAMPFTRRFSQGDTAHVGVAMMTMAFLGMVVVVQIVLTVWLRAVLLVACVPLTLLALHALRRLRTAPLDIRGV